MSKPQTLYRGQQTYLEEDVTADITLDTQPVAFSIDGGATWLTGEWTGTAGTTREARVFVVVTDVFPEPGPYTKLVRVTATPEIEIITGGNLDVR